MDFTFSHERTYTGGTKYPYKDVLHAHHPQTGEVVGTAHYIAPKRRGGKVSVEEWKGEAPGSGSQLFDEIQRRHPGSGIVPLYPRKKVHGPASDEDPRDFGKPTDWDKHYPTLSPTVNRGVSIPLDRMEAKQIHGGSHSVQEDAELLASHVQRNIGMHWSATSDKGRRFAEKNVEDPRAEVPVMLHAQTPQRHQIETRPDVLRRKGVWPFDHYAGDAEVPFKKGTPVHLTGISWKPDVEHPEADEHGWVHHTFEEPRKHTANLLLPYFSGDRLLETGKDEYFGGQDARVLLHQAGRGKPRHQSPDQGGSPSGGAGSGTPQGQQPAGDVGGSPAPARPVTFHPQAVKDLGGLDRPDQKRVKETIEALSMGDPVQTHAIPHQLPGWLSTKASRGHRIIHRSTDEGGIHVGYIGLHDYSKAVRRLSFRPELHSRIFGPTKGSLDPRLFEGTHLRSEVREGILERVGTALEPAVGTSWRQWIRVYLAGSEASEWYGNDDLDVLVGIDYDHAQELAPVLEGLSDDGVISMLNQLFWTAYNDEDWHAPFGGVWHATAYANENAWDIARIKPYAAYDITDDTWVVKPPHLPNWSIQEFPEGPELLKEAEAYADLIEAIDKMPEPYRTRQGKALWDHLHAERSRAFSDEGEGWSDTGNAIEKALNEWGLWDKLVQMKYGEQKTAEWKTPSTELYKDHVEYCPTCKTEHRGFFEPSDHERSYTDWDKSYPRLPEEIHRGMAVQLSPETHATVHGDAPEEEKANSLMREVTSKPLGMHWTAAGPEMAGRISEDEAKHLPSRTRHGTTHVVLHADRPKREHIETDIDRLANSSVISYHDSQESEVPLKEDAPVNLWGVSWKHHDEPGWHFHEFGQPMKRTAARAIPCKDCGGTGQESYKERSWTCRNCGGSGVFHAADHWDKPDLPKEQSEALDTQDYTAYGRKALDLAKNPVPGTHVWRGEIRHKDDIPNPSSVGMHWSVKPEQVVLGHGSPEDQGYTEHHRPVVWQGVVDDKDQGIPRSHPMWRGRHQSMDSEAEVRFHPGTKVRLNGAYVWEGEPGEHTSVHPRYSERTSAGWKFYPTDARPTVAHRPQSGLIDYGDVGIPKEGKAVLSYFTANAEDDDYRMQHRPPDRDDEAAMPIHDLTRNMPADVYTHPHYYSDMSDPSVQDAHAVISRVRGRPEAKVRIYRSLPAEHAHQGFRPGDWITTSKQYARQHGQQYNTDPKHDWPVISTVVKADDLHTHADDLREYGYNGAETKPGTVSFKGGYHQEVRQNVNGEIRPVTRRPKSSEETKMWGSHTLKLSPEDYHKVVHGYTPEDTSHIVLKHLGSDVTWHPRGSEHAIAEVDDPEDSWHAERHAQKLMDTRHREGAHEPGTAPLLGVTVHTRNGKTIDRVSIKPHVDYSDVPRPLHAGFNSLPLSRAVKHPSLQKEAALQSYFEVAA